MMRSLLLATAVAVGLLLAATERPTEAGRTYAYGQVVNNANGRATVTGRKYYCSSGNYHGALDLAAPCGKYALATLYGKRYWRWYKKVSNSCASHSSGGLGNYSMVSGSNGYQFLMGHLNSYSGSRSAYYAHGARLANVGSTGHSTGAHTHMTNMRNWTKQTSWITSYYTSNNRCGSHPNYTTKVGYPQLS